MRDLSSSKQVVKKSIDFITSAYEYDQNFFFSGGLCRQQSKRISQAHTLGKTPTFL